MNISMLDIEITMTIHRNKISRIYYRMNYLDLLPDDLIEIINKN